MSFNQTDISKIDHIIQNRPLLHKNDYLYKASYTFAHIYAVRSGCIKTISVTESDEEQITGFYLPGEILGLDGLSDNIYANSAMAVDTSSVCEIPFQCIEEISTQLPGLQRHIFKIMSREIVTDQQAMVLLSKNKADERIAAFLLSLSSRFQRQHLSASHFTLPMSRGDIGNYLGLTIETVSRIIAKFRKSAIVDINGRDVIIHDLVTMQSLAGITQKIEYALYDQSIPYNLYTTIDTLSLLSLLIHARCKPPRLFVKLTH